MASVCLAPVPSARVSSAPQLRLAELLSALSFALDLTEGQPMGHAVASCLIGLRLAEELSLSEDERSDLYYALLLKDIGCSSNAARMCQIVGGGRPACQARS